MSARTTSTSISNHTPRSITMTDKKVISAKLDTSEKRLQTQSLGVSASFLAQSYRTAMERERNVWKGIPEPVEG